MKPMLLSALALSTALTLPAQALDLDQMSQVERDAFRAQVRAYLLENPEVIMEAVAVLEQRQSAAQAQDDIDLVLANADDLFDDGYSWIGGNPDGDITLVEFMDYRCGYCRRAFSEVHDLLEADSNIRFVIKELPILGEDSMIASRFAIATQQTAGDEAYKTMHDALLVFNGGISETSLTRLANDLGIDAKAVLAHMESDQVTAVIAQNHALAQRLAISGTPSFVMDNHMLRGYLPAADMLRIAEEIRTQ